MSRFLLIDIGAGTMDLLCYDDQSNLHYKAVVKSPVRDVAEKIAATEGNLLISGYEMGGGPVSRIIKNRSENKKVFISVSAAATIHHDPDIVKGAGIHIIEDEIVEELKTDKTLHHFEISDIQTDRIKQIVTGFGVPFSFDAIGICAQDHGVPPVGVSHLDYRHNLFKERLEKVPYPHSLIHHKSEVPPTLNRLNSIAEKSSELPSDKIYLMDSGMAAILGASLDFQLNSLDRFMVLDIATSHTVGAQLFKGELCGFFEYHTKDITLKKLEILLKNLANGTLEHGTVIDQGGHGAWIHNSLRFETNDAIIATGPKRQLIKNSTLPIILGAPMGDNMMTGAVGLLEAIRKRLELPEISYI